MGANTDQEFATSALSGMYLRVTMPDGSKWDIPARRIAINRAIEYADKFGGDIKRSLTEDTIPLFLKEDDKIKHWAATMKWDDVSYSATRVKGPSEPDYQGGLVNGDKEVIKSEDPRVSNPMDLDSSCGD